VASQSPSSIEHTGAAEMMAFAVCTKMPCRRSVSFHLYKKYLNKKISKNNHKLICLIEGNFLKEKVILAPHFRSTSDTGRRLDEEAFRLFFI
jgi:hypothetical protein